MSYTQSYFPINQSLLMSSALAAIPVIVLLGLLAIGTIKAHWAAVLGLAASLGVAIFAYHMPWQLAGMAAVDGAMTGLFPIGWIVLSAIFLFDMCVHTGQFEVVKHSIAGLADDRRVQAVLIAFCFGAFIEGAAGFGTPVAICAAMLIGLGFKPLTAAGIALIGNTAPVAFGGLGIPIVTLASVTGIDENTLSVMVGRQIFPFGILIPFWIVWAMSSFKDMLKVWPACLVAGASFATTQLLVSNLHGPRLVAISASLVSIGSLLLLLKFWQPKENWRFSHEEGEDSAADASGGSEADSAEAHRTSSVGFSGKTTGEAAHAVAVLDHPAAPAKSNALIAWTPWIIMSVTVFIWGLPVVKQAMEKTTVKIAVPLLDGAVLRSPPVVEALKKEEAIFKFNWLSATGTSLFLVAIVSGFVLGLSPAKQFELFLRTLHRVRWSLLTISAMLAIGFSTRYAGLDATLGLAFAHTGKAFPFFSPILGWLGVALTGSDTSSNVLFGNLQQITARKLGLSPILAASANSAGGVMGKMIDAQSIVVASVATGQDGSEGKILRYVFFHSVALAVLMGLLVFGQAYALPHLLLHGRP